MMWLGGGRVVARMRKLSLVEQGKRRWKNAMDRKSKATVERRMRLTLVLGLAHHRDQRSLHCNHRQFVSECPKIFKKNLAKALLLINLRCKHCLMYGVCSVDLPISRDMGDSPALTIIYISFLHVTWAEDKYILELTFKSQSKKARGVTGQPKPLPIVTSLLHEETQLF